MILTVTLNSSIDKLYKAEMFQPGEVNRIAFSLGLAHAVAGGRYIHYRSAGGEVWKEQLG